ncbi:hypothetical protein KUH03_31920 [Sphingobacterium sp. E70]|uniref:hypothetical protein n=1 Tax=Sphingobacterium sp. E70 TaxID=2853439 RepID=UPI00211B9D43|nr:hypothetical protein [Sphingobacterium sp. E70]ULT23720.1 hypothetical protein KUH03_31920 [Sphingobacterium sp. E70]
MKEFSRTAKPEDFQGQAVGYGEWGSSMSGGARNLNFGQQKSAVSCISHVERKDNT